MFEFLEHYSFRYSLANQSNAAILLGSRHAGPGFGVRQKEKRYRLAEFCFIELRSYQGNSI
jgi:hypothetical protein